MFASSPTPRLLSRDEFRKAVFDRDRGTCVFCDRPAIDAHHILERRLFADGGYYLENGISVCELHHRACEATDISTDEARGAASIMTIVVPEGFTDTLSYDKWGNEILASGQRIAGPLFEQLSVRTAVAEYQSMFVPEKNVMEQILKYPRTSHLVGSKLQPGDTSEGQVSVASILVGEQVWEEKLDGGNCALSFNDDLELILQSRGHVLAGGPRERHFDMFKRWANTHLDALFDLIGTRYIVYGEWLYAAHTCFYDALPHFFLEFDIWDKEEERFLDTPSRHRLLRGDRETPLIVSVPVVHTGRLKTTKEVRALIRPSLYRTENWKTVMIEAARKVGVSEEQVLRDHSLSELSEGLYLKVEDGGSVIGRYKFVRPDFLQTILESGTHWLDRTIIPNRLALGVDIFAT